MTVVPWRVATARVPRNIAAWARERFPLALVAVLAPAWVVAVLYGRALTHPGPPRLRPGDLAALAGVWALFLLIRVVDEHKDYERDRAEHPDRVLQRGLVTLNQLKVLAGAAIAVQIAVVLTADGGSGGAAVGRAALWWTVTLGWLCLAAKDFFLGRWFADRPVLYPLLHLPLSGLICVWLAQLGAGARGMPAAGFAVAALGITLSGSVDLVRKLLPGSSAGRAYVTALGTRRTAMVGAVAIAVQTAVLASLVRLADGSAAAVMALPVLAVGPQVALARFAGRPTPADARRARAGLALLVPVQLVVATVGLLGTARGW